jgi:hypothetical protein
MSPGTGSIWWGVRTAEKQRVEKLLEDVQIKLSVVASDIFGVSGREMMTALIGGQTNPKALAQLARGRLRAKLGELEEAFTGHFTDHHGFLLGTCWPGSTRWTLTSLRSTPRSRS